MITPRPKAICGRKSLFWLLEGMGAVYRLRSWEVMSSTTNRKYRGGTGSGQGCKLSKPTPCDMLSAARLDFLRVPQPAETVPTSPWGTLFFHSATCAISILLYRQCLSLASFVQFAKQAGLAGCHARAPYVSASPA